MALGLEQAIAEFLADEGIGVLYPAANASIFVTQQPPAPTREGGSPNAVDEELAVTVFADGGAPPQLTIGESWTITIQVRHPLPETALETQRAVYDLLQENGGQSNGANVNAQGNFRGIPVWRITADFPPILLGRDQDGRDGRYLSTQSFTVRTKHFSFS